MSRRRTLVAGLLVCGASLPVAPAHARTLSLGDRNLKQGMHGRDVRVLQDFLTKVGIRTNIDGQYGPATTRRVRKWEKQSSLQVDGRMTRKDAAILRGQVNDGDGSLQGNTGGVQPTAPAGEKATLGADGLAIAPASAPPEVQQVIAAANEIVGKPYRYGGGHSSFEDSAFDCSGSESHALHGADLVDRPMDSTEFMSWGEPGEGTWITSYANSGHSFLVVAGLRFDTGYNDSSSSGPKWSDKMRPTGSYTARHPEGL